MARVEFEEEKIYVGICVAMSKVMAQMLMSEQEILPEENLVSQSLGLLNAHRSAAPNG